MSLVRGNSGAYYYRGSSLPSLNTFTLTHWVRYGTSSNFNNCSWSVLDASNNFMVRADGTGLGIQALTNNGTSGVSLFTASLNTWYFIATTINGTALNHYHGALGSATLTNVTDTWAGSTITAPTGLRFLAQYDGFGQLASPGSAGGFKIWTAVLSADEILTEFLTWRPQRFTNLLAWYPTFSGSTERKLDYFGGVTLLENGTGLTESENPALPYGNSVIVLLKPSAAASPQTISGAGNIASAESVSNPTLTLNVTGTSNIATAEATSSPQLTLNVTGAGDVATGEAVSSPTVNLNIAAAGDIATGETVSNPTLSLNVSSVGNIASVESVSNPQLNLNINAVGDIASGEAIGSPVVSNGAATIDGAGDIASSAAIGQPQLNQTLPGIGDIVSGEALGLPGVLLRIVPVDIGSAESVSNPTLTLTINAGDIASGEAVPSPTLENTGITLSTPPSARTFMARDKNRQFSAKSGRTFGVGP